MLLSAFVLVLGVLLSLMSLNVQIVTGGHAATLACACFLFVTARGVWKNNRDQNAHQKKMETMMIDLIRRTPLPGVIQYQQPQDYQQQLHKRQ